MNDSEAFTRMFYHGTVQMGISADDFWLMPIGLFLDFWACHKQWHGLEKAKRELSIDEVVLEGI